jgi:putative ABC transport system substrate-binding protein
MKRFVFNVIPLLLACIVASFSSAGIVRAQEILATIVIEDLPRYQKVHDAMSKVLQAGGFSEEKLKIFKQTPNADKMSLTNSLRRAEAAGATLILTYGSQATSIAKDTVKDTPLLFADVYDPVALGVVKTLATPGTDASGATSKTNMETLVDALIAIKQVKTVGVLYTKGEKGSEEQLAEIKEKGKAFGFKVVAENARNPKEAKELGNKLAGQTEALYLTESIAVAKQSKDILASAQAGKCIVFSQIPGLVEAGSLIGLEAELEEQGRLVAVHALQALQGQKVYILPVREAKKVSLKINNATASQLGLTIPPAVASTAKLM